MGKSYFKALCYFPPLARPLRGTGLQAERQPHTPFPGPSQPSDRAPPLSAASPAGGAQAPLHSHSHWLLPVANPRDRRRGAPPPNPAPEGSGSGAFQRDSRPTAACPAGCAADAHKVAVSRCLCLRRGRRQPHGVFVASADLRQKF